MNRVTFFPQVSKDSAAIPISYSAEVSLPVFRNDMIQHRINDLQGSIVREARPDAVYLPLHRIVMVSKALGVVGEYWN